MLVISALSSEYVRVSVAAAINGSDIDPSGDAVSMAFVPQGTSPTLGDWKTASWETDTTIAPPIHYVRAIVGPSGVIALTPALYDCWLKVTDSPEVPIKKAGPLRVI